MKTTLQIILVGLTLALGAILAIKALAQDRVETTPRRIDFSAPLISTDQKPLTNGDAKNPETITLRVVAIMAMETPTEADRNESAEAKYRRGDLEWRIRQSKEPIALTASEIALLVSRVGQCPGLTPIAVRIALPMLDPAIVERWK